MIGVPAFTPGTEPHVCTGTILENFHLHDRYNLDFGILMIFVVVELALTAIIMRLSKFRK